MTGEKNRFKTTEKLWDLDDKQLKTPVHDAMVLWLMDEDNLKRLLFNLCYTEQEIIYSSEEIDVGKIQDVRINYESEKPIMSSPTFIAGYGDLVVAFKFNKVISKEKFPISSKWYSKIKKAEYFEDIEKLLQEYYNDKSFKAKMYGEERDYVENYYDNEGSLLYSYQIEDMNIPYTVKSCYRNNNFQARENKFADFLFNINCGIEEITSSDIYWMENENKYLIEHYGCHCLIEVKPYIDSFGAVLRQIKSYKQFFKKRFHLASHKPFFTQYCLFTFDDRFDKQFESQGIKVLHPDISKKEMLDKYGF